VEDDEDFREIVREVLTRAGYRLREAGNGADGLAAFAAERPDLVILDINLPDLLGIEVCRRMRTVDAATPILLCSVRSATVSVAEGLEAGADGYILKPFDDGEFLERIAAGLKPG
jgi:DNA-binding response OmpR family regulator